MKATFDDKDFMKTMKGLIDYSVGFLDGVKASEVKLLENLGNEIREVLKNYIDSNARINPDALHHVYEWYQTGSPAARLFDIDYQVGGHGLTFNYTLSQSKSVANGSTVPFYDKANIMESGIPVVIRPKRANKLVFTTSDGDTVFTTKPVVVANPGGPETTGAFERIIDEFFSSYFTQAYLNVSGIFSHLNTPSDYLKNLQSGVRLGKARGKMIGYAWATKGGTII